jgi:hypothetical protein
MTDETLHPETAATIAALRSCLAACKDERAALEARLTEAVGLLPSLKRLLHEYGSQHDPEDADLMQRVNAVLASYDKGVGDDAR